MTATEAKLALDIAREHLIGLRSTEGWWKAELETNVTIDAEDLLLRLLERAALVELLEQARVGVHLTYDVVHLRQGLGRRLDHHVDAVPEDVELEVGDQSGYLDEGVVHQVETRHLAVDPHESVVHA